MEDWSETRLGSKMVAWCQDEDLLQKQGLVLSWRLDVKDRRKISSLMKMKQSTSNKKKSLGLAVSISGILGHVKDKLLCPSKQVCSAQNKK